MSTGIITIDQLPASTILSKNDWLAISIASNKKTVKSSFTQVIELLKGDFYTKTEIITLLKAAQTGGALLNSKADKSYVDAADASLQAQLNNVVHLTGNETIDGIKTFNSTIAAPVLLAGSVLVNNLTAIGYSFPSDIAFGSLYNVDNLIFTAAKGFTWQNATTRADIMRLNAAGDLQVNRNVTAEKFIGDGSLLTNLPTTTSGGGSVTIEQNLTSQSTTSVPSVSAVANAITGSQSFIGDFDIYTAVNAGAQIIALPTGASGVLDVHMLEPTDGARPIWKGYYSVANSTLNISVNANIIAGDKIAGSYYINSTANSTINLGKAQIIADGDSLDKGYATSNESTKNWSTQMYTNLDSTKFGQPLIVAVSGQFSGDMLSRQQQYVLNAIDTVNYKQAIIAIGGGHNDLAKGVAPATLKANKIQYIKNIRDWQAANNNFPVKVIMESMTVNGHDYGITSLSDYETYRKQLNSESFTSYKTVYGADYFQNYDSNYSLQDYNNTSVYTADLQHFNDNGQYVRAQLNQPVFNAAQAGTNLAPLASATSAPVNSSVKARWFKADSGVTTTANSLNWTDANGSGDIASNANTSNIKLVPNAINGYPSISFGGGDVLNGSKPAGLSGVMAYQYLAVVKLIDNTNYNILGFGKLNATTSDSPGTIADMLSYTNKLCIHTLGNFNSSGSIPGENSTNAPAIAYGQWAIVGIRHNGNAAQSLFGSTTSSLTPIIRTVDMPNTPITIGGGHFPLGTGSFEIAEIITRNYFSDSDWNADISYLKTKFGL